MGAVQLKRAVERLLGDRSLDPRCVVFCPRREILRELDDTSQILR